MKFTRNPPRRNPQDSWSERVAALESEKAQADVHSAGFQDYIGGDAGSVPYWTVPVPFVAEAFAAFRAAQLPPGILRRVARLAGINRRDYDDRQLAVALYRSYLAPPERLNPADIGAKVHMSRGSRHNPDNSYAVISESPRFASSGMSYAEAKEMADSIGGEVVTVEEARAYKQQMLSEKQGSSFYGTGRSGEFRNVRGRWNPAADPIGRYEALRRMADPSGNASANERQMAELLMAKIEAKLGYVPAAPVTKPTRSTGRKGAAKAIAARRHLENSRRNPDYSHMSQEDLARAYLQGYAAYQEAAADRGYALRKMDEASPREEGAARQAFEAAAAVAEKAMHAYNEFFPLLTEETKQKYLMMRAVASLRMDGTSSIQSAPQDVSRVRAMSRRNPELTLREQYRAHGGMRWFEDKDLMDRYARGEPPPGGAGSAASSPARAVQQVAAARPVQPVPVPRAPAPVVEEAFEEEEVEEPAPPPGPVQRPSEQRGASGFTAREEQDMVAAMSRDIDASGEEQLIIPPGWTKVKVGDRMWNFDPKKPYGQLYAIKKDKLKLMIGWFDGKWQADCNGEIFWTIPVKTVTEALWRGTDQIEKWDAAGKLDELKRNSYGYGY